MLSKINDFYFYGEILPEDERELAESKHIYSEKFASDSSEREVPAGSGQAENFRNEFSEMEPVNFITQCFNLAHRCLGLCLKSFYNKTYYALEFMRSFRKMEKTLTSEQQIQTRKDFDKVIGLYYMQVLSINSTLYDYESAASMLIFFQHTINYVSYKPISERPNLPKLYLKNTMDYLHQIKKLEVNFLDFSMQDEIFFSKSASYSKNFKMIKFNGVEVLSNIFRGASRILSEPDLSIHTRANLTSDLSSLMPNVDTRDLMFIYCSTKKQKDYISEYRKIQRTKAFNNIKNSPNELKKFIQAIMRTYCDCEHTDSHDYFGAIYRRSLFDYFSYFNDDETCTKVISDIALEAKQSYSNNMTSIPLFLNFQTKLFQDSNEFMNEGLEGIEKLKPDKIKLDEFEAKRLGRIAGNSTSSQINSHPTNRPRPTNIYNESIAKLKARMRKPEKDIKWNMKNSDLCHDLVLKLTNRPDIISVFLMNQTNIEQSANMINKYIDLLANKEKRKNLIIGEKKYQKDTLFFNPKVRLTQLCKILINFVVKNDNSNDCRDKFLYELVSDQQFFKLENYEEARAKFTKFFLTQGDLDGFGEDLDITKEQVKQFSTVLEPHIRNALARVEGQNAVDYDDAPDEFLCALMLTIMDDPVRLPSSQEICDRGVVVRQLLNREEDPFNRQPLTVGDLIAMPDLKRRIEQYKAEKALAAAAE